MVQRSTRSVHYVQTCIDHIDVSLECMVRFPEPDLSKRFLRFLFFLAVEYRIRH